MKHKLTLLLELFVFKLFLVNSQFEQSPCPDTLTFNYDSDGANIYGVIRLRPSGPVTFIQLKTNFTIAARLPSQYIGRIEPLGTDVLLLQEFNRGVPISYRVHFPVTSPLPRLTSLSVNDNILCYGPGDIAGPNQYVTTISLQHTLFLRPGGGGNGDPELEQPVVNQPTQTPQYPIYYPEKTTPSSPQIGVQPQQPPIPVQPQPQPVDYPSQPVIPERRPSPSSSSTYAECGVISGGNEQLPLIFNGQSYTRGDWPWLVAIYKRKDGSLTFICAGTLVSDRHVISAAHCLHQKNTVTSIRDIVVKVGVYNLEDWGDDITVTRTLTSAAIHESYNASTLANDILVFTFERSVEFNVNIRPACLWNGDTELRRIVGEYGVVAGWGKSELGPGGHGEPRFVRIPVVSTSTCRASNPDFHKLTSSNTFCAGDRNGVGPCLGDSGGGLYIFEGGRWRIRGVVSLSLRPSNGDSTCNLNEYIIFTDSAKYLRWIYNIINIRFLVN